MSIKQMTRVWELSKHKGTALLLLLAIADNADDDGEAYPGREYLAKKIRMSEQHTRELIIKLIHSHELRLTHRGGSGSGDPHHYKICLKGLPASPSDKGRPTSPKGEAKGRRRGGGPTRNLLEPIEPPPPISTELTKDTSTTTRAVGVVDDSWDLLALLKLGRVTKPRTEEISAMEPRPPASAYVAHYLYAMSIHKINAPAHFAAKRIVEQLTAGEPFEQIADHGPKWLTECLHWIFTDGVEIFDSLTPQALAFKNYLPKETAARMIPRAFDELGLAAYLPPPEEPEPVEFILRPPPTELDAWQRLVEQVKPFVQPSVANMLMSCHLQEISGGKLIVLAPNHGARQWIELQVLHEINRHAAVEFRNA